MRTSLRTINVAADNRERLIAMIATWYAEAGKYDVLPVDGSGIARVLVEKPLLAPARDRYIFFPDTQSVPFFAGPRVLNRPHSITAEVEIPDEGAEGVLFAQGTAAGGYSFYVKDGLMHYAHNYLGKATYTVTADTPVPTGTHALRFEFEPTGELDFLNGKGAPGRMQLYIDGVARRQCRGCDHCAPRHQSRGADLWCRPRFAGHRRLRNTLPVHRDDSPSHHRL